MEWMSYSSLHHHPPTRMHTRIIPSIFTSSIVILLLVALLLLLSLILVTIVLIPVFAVLFLLHLFRRALSLRV